MNKKKILIGVVIVSIAISAFSFWVYKKKKEDESWRLINLPDGVFKRNKNVKINRNK